MYSDFSNSSREGWKYSYLGKELLPFAKKKLAEYSAGVDAAREKMTELLASKVSTDCEEYKRAEKDLKTNDIQRENCEVFVHQFSRDNNREFNLALGDVVFFGLIAGGQVVDKDNQVVVAH